MDMISSVAPIVEADEDEAWPSLVAALEALAAGASGNALDIDTWRKTENLRGHAKAKLLAALDASAADAGGDALDIDTWAKAEKLRSDAKATLLSAAETFAVFVGRDTIDIDTWPETENLRDAKEVLPAGDLRVAAIASSLAVDVDASEAVVLRVQSVGVLVEECNEAKENFESIQELSYRPLSSELRVSISTVFSKSISEMTRSGKSDTFHPSNTEEKELFRGVRVNRLLQRGGALLYLDNEGNVAVYDAFEASQPTSRIDYFLSHSWRTKAMLKIICLKYVLHLTPAFWWGIAVGIMFILLECFGYLPKSLFFFVHIGAGDACQRVYVSLWWFPGALVGILAFWYGYLANPRCTTFLDRCCINQADIDKKMKGLKMLSDVLRCSNKLIVMWTEEYFERLWCCAEIATYVRYRGVKSLVFVPLEMPVFVLSLTIFHLLASLGMCILGPVALRSEITCEHSIGATGEPVQEVAAQEVVNYIMGWALLVVLYALGSPFLVLFMDRSMGACKVLKLQLAAFSIKNAKCTAEADRAVVEADVCRMFGTTEDCDQYLQTHIVKNMELWQILLSQGCQYKDLLLASFGHWLLLASVVSNVEDGDKLHILLGFCFLIFCGDALSMWLIGRILNKLSASSCGFFQRHHLKVGSVLVTVIFTSISSLVLVLVSRRIPLPVKCAFVGCCTLLTWCLYGVVPFPGRCLQRLRSDFPHDAALQPK